MEEVSKALGHGSIKTTEKFYNPWIKTRQERLDGLVMKGHDSATRREARSNRASAASLGCI